MSATLDQKPVSSNLSDKRQPKPNSKLRSNNPASKEKTSERVKLTIDPEFRAFMPRPDSETMTELEASMKQEGCRDRLVVWKSKGRNIVVDGHHRYEICKRCNLEYDVTYLELSDREAVKEWMIRNQIGRRNLTTFQRCELALKLEPIIAARAKNQQGQRRDLPENSQESFIPVNTDAELARLAGCSTDTIRKARTLSENASAEILNRLRNNESSIHAEVRGLSNKLNDSKGSPNSKKPTNGPDLQTATHERVKLSKAVADLLDVRLSEAVKAFPGWRDLEMFIEDAKKVVNALQTLLDEQEQA